MLNTRPSRSKRDQNAVFLSFHDSIIRDSDMGILDTNEWLNDTLISFYFEYLEKEQFAQYKEQVALISPGLTHLIKMEKENVEVFLDPLSLHNKILVIFPINDCGEDNAAGGSHWTLLFYLRSTNAFTHYDSQGHSNANDAKKVMGKTVPFLNTRSQPSFEEALTPQQVDGFNCGIHVICNAEYLCRRHLLGENLRIHEYCSPQMIAGKRRWLKELILTLKKDVIAS